MKVIWFVNIPVRLDKMLGTRGGWVRGMLHEIAEMTNYEVRLAWPHDIDTEGIEYDDCCSRISYMSYYYNGNTSILDEKEIDAIARRIAEYKPDIIQIWGTEYIHSYMILLAAKKIGLLKCCVVHIQGLVSICAKHYSQGVPKHIREESMRERLFFSDISVFKKNLAKRGEFEEKALQLVDYVMGRTEWDKACVYQINPKINYYSCNEVLREEFYKEYQWIPRLCEKHSIFVSQANYPIKGFHYVLQGLSIVKRYYKNVKLYVTGDNFYSRYKLLNCHKNKEKYPYLTYEKYLCSLIKDNRLEKSIVFLGDLNATQMTQMYRRTNVFVSGSTIENSPNSIGEAMMIGTPIVSSYVGGIPSMIEHEKEGFLYPLDEPYMMAQYIMRIFKDVESEEGIEPLMLMSDNVRNKARVIFDRNRNVKALMNIYQTIIKDSGLSEN